MAEPASVADSTIGLPDLTILRARVTYRLLEATTLPPYKGALLRGGFGYAFQRASCPAGCWGHSEQCTTGMVCPYRWVFETPHPAGVSHLHDLQDVPRPFVIEPPLDHKRDYAAGDSLEFGLILIGRGIDYLPYFLYGFEQSGRTGLGKAQAKAKLERVEALPVDSPIGRPIYLDGRVLDEGDLPGFSLRGLSLPDTPQDLHLRLHTPLRVKARGAFIEQLDMAAIVQAAGWRLNALAVFHGAGPWDTDYRPIVEAARGVSIESADVKWVDWERTSTRGGQQQRMILGGLVGTVTLRAVPPAVYGLLRAGSLVHIGKAAVFGHGWVDVGKV